MYLLNYIGLIFFHVVIIYAFHKHFTSLLLLLISFLTKSFFNLEEVADKIYVHFGFQEDTNKINKGDISNIGFIVGDKSILVIDTGGTPGMGFV